MSDNKIMDYATKGAVIAMGVGVAAGAVLSLLTWAPGFLVASLTLGLVINGSLGAMIGAGIGFLARNEKEKKHDCGPNEANHVTVDPKESKDKRQARMEEEEKQFERVWQKKVQEEKDCKELQEKDCDCPDEKQQPSARFQDKLCDAKTVEAMQR